MGFAKLKRPPRCHTTLSSDRYGFAIACLSCNCLHYWKVQYLLESNSLYIFHHCNAPRVGILPSPFQSIVH